MYCFPSDRQIPNFTSLITYASSIFGGFISFIVILCFFLSVAFKEPLDDFLKSICRRDSGYIHGVWSRLKKNGPLAASPGAFKFYNGAHRRCRTLDLGDEYAFLIAMIAGVLEIVPFVGPIVACG